MKTLITGHMGFVGAHFWRRFSDNSVIGIDVREPVFPKDARDFFRHDETRVDLAIHCAAVVGGRAMIQGSPLDVAVDLAIDAEFIQWCLRTRPKRIVYFSSSAVYPIVLQTEKFHRPLRELDVWGGMDLGRPDLTYGWAKLTGEYQLQFLEAEGIKVHCFRPFSGYGPGQTLEYPFPSFIDRASRRADPFEIWGDGTQQRDFIHIEDIVGAVLTAIDQDLTGVVNLCTGRGTSFNELAEIACTEAGYSPTIHHELEAPVGVHCRVGDPSNMLGFYTPKIDLETGVAMALEYPF